MEKQESVGDDRDELDVESVIAEENIDPSIFSIRNALEQPDAKVYTTLELHSKPSFSKSSPLASKPLTVTCRAVQIHNGKIDLNPPYQRGAIYLVFISHALC